MVTFFKQHDYKNELNKFSLKATPARIAVMNFLENSNEPTDVSSIIRHFKNENLSIDPATIFRMMNDFVKRGVIRQIQFEEGKARYELSAKGDHHHLICENCGKIEAVSDKVIPEMEKEIQRKQHFLVKRHTLEFFGICKNCQR